MLNNLNKKKKNNSAEKHERFYAFIFRFIVTICADLEQHDPFIIFRFSKYIEEQ